MRVAVTIYEVLTVADAIPLTVTGLRVNDSLPRCDSARRLRRDMMNNGKIYESVEKMLRESIVPSAEVSKRYNATYGASDFNAGMLHAAMLDTSVGGCGLVMREITAQSIENPRYSRHSPSDEWFRNILSKTDECKALETFNQVVRAQLDEICLLGRLPDVLDVAIDMHLIPCHSKKLGSDLRGGERKSGTNRFEAYITAQWSTPNRLGSDTWLKNPTPVPIGVLITVQLYDKLEQTLFKLLQLDTVPYSRLSHLATLLPGGTSVCSLMVHLSGGSAWKNREQNDSKAASRMNQLVLTSRRPVENFRWIWSMEIFVLSLF